VLFLGRQPVRQQGITNPYMVIERPALKVKWDGTQPTAVARKHPGMVTSRRQTKVSQLRARLAAVVIRHSGLAADASSGVEEPRYLVMCALGVMLLAIGRGSVLWLG